MCEKLKELSEILKQNTDIKERLERLEFGCWISTDETKKEEFIRIISINKDQVQTEPTKYNSEYFDIDEIKTGIGISDEEIKLVGREPQYSDILEYLGDEDYCLYHGGIGYLGGIIISLSHGPLSDQSDETLTQIISLCKNVGEKK